VGHFLFPWTLLIAQSLAGAEIFPLRWPLGYRVAAARAGPPMWAFFNSNGVVWLHWLRWLRWLQPASLALYAFFLSESVDCHDGFDITLQTTPVLDVSSPNHFVRRPVGTM